MKISLRLMGGSFIPATKEDAENIKQFQKDAVYVVDIKVAKRTDTQRRAYFLWATMIADILNKENKDLKYEVDLSKYWNKDIVHETLLKKILKDKFNKDSTTKMNKDEVNQFIDEVVLFLANNGIECPDFPNRED